MAIPAGTRLGPYEVVSLIGAGGMGEVYSARDARLNRNVALKVLPEIFASDTQRMARFEREAKMLASLNHPNIAAIYGLEESGPFRGLVMELVEGPTLSERIAAGPIPLDEALPIARQIADAVEYAHDQNVIHRDLKPANIKVKEDGTVKVLDFGLAKAMSDEIAEADMSNSPTLSMAATRQGVILGTAAYMSPEQAKGKRVDRRTDVWAFGCVLYEMITGEPAFHGEDVTDILAAIVMKEPALEALPAKTSAAIRNLVRRCLEKNVRRRLGHMSEARILIEDVLSGAATTEAVAAGTRKSREGLFAAAAGIAIVIALAAWGAFAYFRPAPQKEAVRFLVLPPEGWTLPRQGSGTAISAAPLMVSPDGRRIVFTAVGSGAARTQLWLRSLDVLAPQALPGTEGGHAPFWSPDGRSLAFFADGKLKKIDISGGPAVTLCNGDGDGGTWSRDGIIVFNPAIGSPLQKIPAVGGTPTVATTLGQGEVGHRNAYFMPDGRHFLYVAVPGDQLKGIVDLASLDSAERTRLFEIGSSEIFYSDGYILFLREATLMAQPFDPKRLQLTGEAFPIAEDIQTSAGTLPYGYFSTSENGVLAYRTGAGVTGASQLTWYDRTGKQTSVLGDTALSSDVQLSPDGKQVSVSILDPAKRTRDIWIYDVARGLKTRFTFDPADELTLIWSPDGKRAVFNSRRKGHMDLYQKAADGSGTEEVLFEDNLDKYPVSFSPDGKFLLYVSVGGETRSDLYVLPLSGDRRPTPFVNSQFGENPGGFSPDGRWGAYTSDESGRGEVYVAPFPGPGGKRQVSAAGGAYPRWSRDGGEIFYVAPDNNWMAAAVNGKGTSFEVGAVKPLFQTRRAPGGRFSYDVSPDGQRFLINTAPEQVASDAPITVVLNWTAGLKK